MPVLDIHEVVDSVMTLVRSRPGRLVAVTVVAPLPHRPQEVADTLRAELESATHHHVEVSARTGGGPLRLLAAEFSR